MAFEVPGKNCNLDYTDLAQAFVEKPAEFSKMLKLVYEDFINNHMLMIDAVQERNLLGFRKIHHDLRANIILFKISALDTLMDTIEAYLISKSPVDQAMIENLNGHFNFIFQNLENKIKELEF